MSLNPGVVKSWSVRTPGHPQHKGCHSAKFLGGPNPPPSALPSSPLLFLPFLLPLLFTFLPLEVGPLIQLGGLGECCK